MGRPKAVNGSPQGEHFRRANSFCPRRKNPGVPAKGAFCGVSLARVKSMNEETGVEFVD